ncbi:MAG: ribonuclease [Rhodospirillaceae bacterium]|nr:ribonuclease [Rhodospirillaceae bacterium]
MTKRMLIDATHPEETRVAVVDGRRLEEFDVEVASKKQLKGNIYLAKITRVEPSLQAAFVEYGGNRHGFLAFSEIHPDYYRIPVEDREALLAEQAALAREQDAEQDAESDGDGRFNERRRTRSRGGDREASSQEPAAAHDDTPDGAEGAPVEGGEAAALRVSGDSSASLRSEPFEPADASAVSGEISTDQPTSPADSRPAGEDAVPADEAAASAGYDNGNAVAEVSADEAPDHRAVIEETAAVPHALETVGGDETEDHAGRRPRQLSRRYKIQDVIKRRQILLVQVTKEERGNKGAALTTYLSLAGRYCVLMPNTDRGGGVSRKITNAGDRKRLKSIIEDLELPSGMAVIVRTAGSERTKPEVKRDFEYLIRLWDEIRELTLRSTAPALIYEEANLIKRAIRDLYTRDIEDIQVEGDEAYKAAKSFMRMLTPSHAKRVQQYRDPAMPLFTRYQIESQLDAIHNPVVQLKSGGYIVINQTEALVAIDVNSGRATRERNIEETALKTNLEASDEIARQLRLRDMAGLIVIDFIDMDEQRHNGQVERRLKEAMRNDRARIQLGRISAFGLLELSRQRLRPSLVEASTEVCRHCRGTGHVRSTESTALHVLRSIEEEGARNKSAAITVSVPGSVALFILNHKRLALAELEARQGLRIYLAADESLVPPEFRIERLKALAPGDVPPAPVIQPSAPPVEIESEADNAAEESEPAAAEEEEQVVESRPAAVGPHQGEENGEHRRGRRRRRRGRDRHPSEAPQGEQTPASFTDGPVDLPEADDEEAEAGSERIAVANGEAPQPGGDTSDPNRRRRRRGRRGGRRRRRTGGEVIGQETESPAGPMEQGGNEAEWTPEPDNGESFEAARPSWEQTDLYLPRYEQPSIDRPEQGEPAEATHQPEPEKTAAAESAVEPAAQPEPTPVPSTEPTSIHAPEPSPASVAEAEPTHAPEPSPEPSTKAEPTRAPEPSPASAAEAEPTRAPEPSPAPEATPAEDSPAAPRKKGWWQRVLS